MTMAQRTAREVEAILADHSPGPQTSWVTCTGCRARGEVADTKRLSDADVAARLNSMGWSFAGWARWLCTECSATTPTERTEPASHRRQSWADNVVPRCCCGNCEPS